MLARRGPAISCVPMAWCIKTALQALHVKYKGMHHMHMAAVAEEAAPEGEEAATLAMPAAGERWVQPARWKYARSHMDNKEVAAMMATGMAQIS